MIQIHTKQTGKKYWRSLDQLSQTSEFKDWLHREFPTNASEMTDGTSRRNLLKLMAASLGLAGLTACRRPVEKVLPNVRGVEDYIPGRPFFYSTAMNLGGVATGLLVEVNDGRPTKIEGNPQHPFSLGAANGYQQASVLGLYDPDRARNPRKDGQDTDWKTFDAFAKEQFEPAKLGQGDGLRFLSDRVNSPSLLSVKAAALAKYPKAKWIEYNAVSHDESEAGAQLAFGQPVITRHKFDKADVIVSLDDDFLGLDSSTVLPMKEFSRRRRITSPKDEMNRLYMVESQYSVTGAMADHRLRMRSSEVRSFVADLAAELKVGGNELKIVGGNKDEKRTKWISVLAKDLSEHKGKSLVVAGPRQPAAVHAMVHLINQALGNVGESVVYLKGTSDQFHPQLEALKELSGEMSRGQVSTLVILGANPAYTAPADFNFTANLKKVANSIYLGLDVDETAVASKWSLPEAHYLETWGDATAPDGTATVQQPMIQPLYFGRSAVELVAQLTGYKDQRGYDIVRNYWIAKFGGKAEAADKTWRKSLHDGVIAGTALAEFKPTLDAKKVNAAIQTLPAGGDSGVEVVFVQSASVYDGRFANNGWMQEAPDPMTKLTWDNAALLSPATAKKLGVVQGDVIAIERRGRGIQAPVLVQPGQADNSVSIALGYGRTESGRVGKNVGVNAYPLRTSDAFTFAADASIRKVTADAYPLAQTQDHHSMEGRPLVREASLEEYRKEPKFAQEMVEHPPLVGLYPDHDYSKGSQWGMAIDLTSCIGCNACLVACQSENNIPIVGKDQVIKGREMHWIRMDRYYTGSEEDPQVVTQPVTCMQCETAPCENVCPVAATTHSPEGLNDMAYNRCVGTRYCSNNCPYKVRRFNFLAWNYGTEEVQKMHYNPNVTVRMRGVMEKCTYCVQRIQEKKILAKTEGRRAIKDGEIQTACQQTCPADAIVFGNINDPESRVAKLKQQTRNYSMLEELNTKPRTTYLAKLRNPNEELEAHHG
jgi:MoCo/4Fe-4S cofactor protein with predicted Tat translocation signal